jgi:hypothetical protein
VTTIHVLATRAPLSRDRTGRRGRSVDRAPIGAWRECRPGRPAYSSSPTAPSALKPLPYFTITNAYIFANTKCGTTRQITRYVPG